MGVWMKQIPVKLPLETIERVRLFAQEREIPVGMSTAIRHMVEDFLSRMSSGIVQFAAEQGNRVPGVQSIQSVPNEFPSAVESPETLLGKKPPVRVQVKVGANRGREFRGVSRRMGVVGMELAYKPPFLSKLRPFKSNICVNARVA